MDVAALDGSGRTAEETRRMAGAISAEDVRKSEMKNDIYWLILVMKNDIVLILAMKNDILLILLFYLSDSILVNLYNLFKLVKLFEVTILCCFRY